MERAEHLAWCKSQALEYLDRGDVTNAVASMVSDMGKHPDCGIHPFVGQLGLLCAMNNDAAEARRWIIGFR